MHTLTMLARMSCLILLVGMTATTGCVEGAEDNAAPRIAATVNGAVISRDDVAARVAAGATPQHALDDLIDLEVVAEAAHAAHISITAAELDYAYAEVKRQNQFADDAAIASVLAKYGYTVRRYRAALEREMLEQRAINAIVAPGVTTTDPKARHAELDVKTRAWIEQLRREAVIEIAVTDSKEH
jgi:SurA N-terminal domain